MTLCLGIESTAHTFGAAIVEKRNSSSPPNILADVKDSYRPPTGSGIHPREASRHHEQVCSGLILSALQKAKVSARELDFIAYSAGPGLGPCLRVGAVISRAISTYFDIPLVAVNHAIGHIELGKYFTGLFDPLVLIVSGGHTALTAVQDKSWAIFGETLDLTLGQLLDQLGRFFGLASPAGQVIEQLAQSRAQSKDVDLLELPYTIKGNDVSYSGLLSKAKSLASEGRWSKEDICFGIQEVSFAILAEATERALAFTSKDELLVTGGVAANMRLSSVLSSMCDTRGVRLGVIPQQFAGDCGSQIGVAGFSLFESGRALQPIDAFTRQSWRIDQVLLN